jgi:hypothetical protein
MASRRVSEPVVKRTRRPPATTPEGRENQLIAKAVDLAERQIEEGTASSQVISHFLKLGSSREHLEQLRLEKEVELMEAKKEALAAGHRLEELMTDAITAFKSYSGGGAPEVTE